MWGNPTLFHRDPAVTSYNMVVTSQQKIKARPIRTREVVVPHCQTYYMVTLYGCFQNPCSRCLYHVSKHTAR